MTNPNTTTPAPVPTQEELRLAAHLEAAAEGMEALRGLTDANSGRIYNGWDR